MTTTTIEDRGQRRELVEQRRDRLALVREAGFQKVSGLSVAAGALAALGAFALAIGAAALVIRVVGIDTSELSDGGWRAWGAGAGAFASAALLIAFFLGGYTAGRMARRAGLLHGVVAGVCGIVVLALVFAAAYFADGTEVIVDRVERLGAPTAGGDWAGIVAVIGAAALAAVLVGGLLGGARGERWHQRLMDRALDPKYGPEADLMRRHRELEAAEQRLERQREEAERRGVLVTTRETPPTGTPAVADGAVAAPPETSDAQEEKVEKEEAIASDGEVETDAQPDLRSKSTPSGSGAPL